MVAILTEPLSYSLVILTIHYLVMIPIAHWVNSVGEFHKLHKCGSILLHLSKVMVLHCNGMVWMNCLRKTYWIRCLAPLFSWLSIRYKDKQHGSHRYQTCFRPANAKSGLNVIRPLVSRLRVYCISEFLSKRKPTQATPPLSLRNKS